MGDRCSTKEAVMLLEAGGVLECIPHEVDPAAKLTTAAIAMRRSSWWHSVPDPAWAHNRGTVLNIRKGWELETNHAKGEIPWR